ncbi:MAG: hypothetical protein COA79_11170 [Planctomycetota bacterium]|nr:MAG: hypothetical protein COA79_11170 [Planctomycetota bacterium]
MDFDKEKILSLLPDFLSSLEDDEFKKTLIEAKANPELMANPLAMFTIVMPKLTEILKKNNYEDKDAAQKFIGAVMMNQADPEILAAFQKLKDMLK